MTTKLSTRVVGGAFALALGTGLALPAVAHAQDYGIPHSGPIPNLDVETHDDGYGIDITVGITPMMGDDDATCGYVILNEGVEIEPSSLAWSWLGGGGPEFTVWDNNFVDNSMTDGSPQENTNTASYGFYTFATNDDDETVATLNSPYEDGEGTYRVHTSCWWDGDNTSASYGPTATYTLGGGGVDGAGGVTDIDLHAPQTPGTGGGDNGDDDNDDNGSGDDDDNGGGGDGSLDGGSLGGGSSIDSGSAAAVSSLALGGGVAAAIHAHNIGLI